MQKQEVDTIRNDCKQTMSGIIYHLIQSCIQNDSDAWFSIIDIQEPNDIDFESFLDVADHTEEIQRLLL